MWKSDVTLSVLQMRFLECVKDINMCIYLREQRFLTVVIILLLLWTLLTDIGN